MCTVLLPPGGNPVAVKYISYHISYHISYNISYHVSCYHVIMYHVSYIIYHIAVSTVQLEFDVKRLYLNMAGVSFELPQSFTKKWRLLLNILSTINPTIQLYFHTTLYGIGR